MQCQKCGGSGVIEKPVAQGMIEEEDCDLCGGAGELPEPEEGVPEKLDRIIELLEKIYSGMRSEDAE